MAARSCRVVLIVEDEAAIALDLEDTVERLAGHVVVGPVATITAALDAKLDELLRAIGDARTELSRIDAEEPEAIEKARADAHES